VVAIGVHRVEIRRRQALGRNDGRPPLIADCGDVHEIEQLEGDVGLHQRIRLTLVEHPAAQIGEPLLLERRRGNGGVELLGIPISPIRHGVPPRLAPLRPPVWSRS
jgi:hypothetical protein